MRILILKEERYKEKSTPIFDFLLGNSKLPLDNNIFTLATNHMIRFYYQYPKFKLKQARKIKLWINSVAGGENKKIDYAHYIFVSDQYLLELNKSALQHDYFTDIITFPYAYDPVQCEIYISIDRVKDHALLYQHSCEKELHRVMVHGMLHMCGYDDTSKAKKIKMTTREDYWLKQFDLS